ncbi:hypothetical protein [Sphingobium limneticum]|uniref:hypothetical protein n=1 Tax=Sphingobium limneticum TaxID=1007511 RepID=UPI001B86DBA4|nr:hypothetical protein [Sphingobium limneticum]
MGTHQSNRGISLAQILSVGFRPLPQTPPGTVNGLSWEKGDCLLLEGDCAFTLTTGPVSALLAIPR